MSRIGCKVLGMRRMKQNRKGNLPLLRHHRHNLLKHRPRVPMVYLIGWTK